MSSWMPFRRQVAPYLEALLQTRLKKLDNPVKAWKLLSYLFHPQV